MTTRPPPAPPPLVVLIEPKDGRHHHAEMLSRAGFRVVSIPAREATVGRVLAKTPSVVAVELDPSHQPMTFEFTRQFRQDPHARLVPFVVYGHHLRADDIEAAA